MTCGNVYTEIDGPVGRIVLANPEKQNATDLEMYRAIPGAVERLLSDAELRVIVVRGEGHRAFGAGSDIAQFENHRLGDDALVYNAAEEQASAALRNAALPVVALIHGVCVGASMVLALGADVRYASHDATFAIPAGRLGLGYPLPGAARRLCEVIGVDAARELVITGRTVDAEEAKAIGLIHRVIDKDRLDSEVSALTASIASSAPLTLRAAKLVLGTVGDPASREIADAALLGCFRSDDYREGISAFLNRRQPHFRGT